MYGVFFQLKSYANMCIMGVALRVSRCCTRLGFVKIFYHLLVVFFLNFAGEYNSKMTRDDKTHFNKCALCTVLEGQVERIGEIISSTTREKGEIRERK